MKYKKAFYFTLDAFLAVAILAVGFILIISSFASKPSKVQTRHISDDMLNVLATVKWSELESSYNLPKNMVGTVNTLEDKTLLEAIGELYYISDDTAPIQASDRNINAAKQIIEKTIKNIIPPQFSYEFVLIDNERTTPEVEIIKGGTTTKEEASFLTSSKKFVFGTYLGSSNTIQPWGPYIIEARVWRK